MTTNENEIPQFSVLQEHRLSVIVDELRMDNVRITTTLQHVEHDLKAHKDEVHIALGRLNEKIDALSQRFNEVAGDVKVMAAKIAFGAILFGMVLQVVAKHFGLI